MRISDWSSDVCPSDLDLLIWHSVTLHSINPCTRIAPRIFSIAERPSTSTTLLPAGLLIAGCRTPITCSPPILIAVADMVPTTQSAPSQCANMLSLAIQTTNPTNGCKYRHPLSVHPARCPAFPAQIPVGDVPTIRSEEHTSELQTLMRISYAVF